VILRAKTLYYPIKTEGFSMTRTLAHSLCFALLMTGAPTIAIAAPANAAKAMTPSERLRKLFADSDEASLKRNPLNALLRGDLRYADQLGEFITDAAYNAERAAGRADLKALQAIPRMKLTPIERIAYDVFEAQTLDGLKGLSPEILALTRVRPINHFFGFHIFYTSFASGTGAAPFKTVVDYDNNLKRHREFVVLMDRSIARFREGMKSGVFETKMTIRNVIEQLDTQLKQAPEESPYYAPAKNIPATFSNADSARIPREYKAAIADGIFPAYRRLRNFLNDEYLPVAREAVGLSAMKGGAKLYDYLIESSTTLPLGADYIHNLGLSEVARIRTGMEGVKTEVGFKGSLAEFFEYLRTDSKFKPTSREALTQSYYDIGKKVDALVPQYFSTVPKSKLEIRPYEEFREKFEAGGGYQQGTSDGKTRPGIFYFNAYDLPSRTTPGMTTLYLHEGSPGHHFQISLAQENEALPPFMRFGGNTAYVEGWALYAETLGYQMGFFKDPYQRMGTLSDEMLRAMRLVIDTGLHTKGWSREKAINYMMANSNIGKTDATAEVERYIAIPTQALAYKIGALTIQRLRADAEKRLGTKFDIRKFHAQVLMTGALPLSVLEKKIDDWVKAGGA
jgi:uncharacterized protein (DUF885 family)